MKDALDKSIQACKNNLSKISLGRAQSDVFDLLKIDYYGTLTSLPHCSIINVLDHSRVSIQPHDKNMIKEIEKLIRNSGLNLNPLINGSVINVNFPQLTLDRRDEMIKLAKSYGEKSKVVIRGQRHELLKEVESATTDKNERAAKSKIIEGFVKNAVLEIDQAVAEKIKKLNELGR